MTTKLKPCPFCGIELEDGFPVVSRMGDGEWVVSHYCKSLRRVNTKLGVTIDVYGATREEAFRLWNTRAGENWISVSTLMPEDLPVNEEKKVIPCLVTMASAYPKGKPSTQYRQRRFDPYLGWQWSKIGACRVTHWMPLPTAAEEG